MSQETASKKRLAGSLSVCAGNYPSYSKAQLPFVEVKVEDTKFCALLDSGCSQCVISNRVVSSCGFVVYKKTSDILMMDGSVCSTVRICNVTICYENVCVTVNCLV